jgi:hypothetical protein
VDSSGNVYITGESDGSTSADYATVKYAPNGNELWAARYDGPGNGHDDAVAIAVDSSSNVYVTGKSHDNDLYYDYATIKYDTNGNELWLARYNGPANSNAVAYAIAVDTSGNVYVTGNSVGSGTANDYTTVKYDTNGNELWTARYNGPGNSYDNARAIAVDSSGNVYVTGSSQGGGTGPDYGTVKYDTNGNELWAARYDGPGTADGALAIALDSSGNVYVTGWSKGSSTEGDYATVKYNGTNGNELWAARYDGPANSWDYARAIAVDSSGVYVTGDSDGGGTDEDYATIKYDTNTGEQLWLARHNGPGNSGDYATAIAMDSSGNVYVAGGSSVSDSPYDTDYATVKYDTNGNELWVARYNGHGPGTASDFALAIALDTSGNVYVTGRSIGLGWGYVTVKYSQVTNQPPLANAGTDQSVHPGDVVTLDGSASTDPDENYPLTYSWQITQTPEGSTTDLLDSGSVNPTLIPDLMGNYIIELVVTDSLGAQSTSDSVLVSTYNTPPVADGGDDQAIIELYSVVQLDGTQSYDEDGDDFTYLWAITQKPAESMAALSDPFSATPTFVADVHGDYIISLTVTDIFVAVSDPVATVTVSFTNVKPVADAGGSQAVIVGETVFLDGSDSNDENGDPLTYSWSFASMPEGSLAELSDPTVAQTSFVADEVGTFVVSLVVNDGFVDSKPANVTIEAISCVDAGVQVLLDLIEAIRNLDESSLKNRNMKTPLINKINAVLSKVENGFYEEAVDKLQNDLLQKTNGCAEISEPDRNDWLITCEAQNQIYPLIMNAIAFLENPGSTCF